MKMRMGSWLVGCGLVLLCGLLASGQEKAAPKTKERTAIDAARAVYDQDLIAAEVAYTEALERSKKKLLAAYEAAITTAMKRVGGDGLDLANELNAEKKNVQERAVKDSDGTLALLSRDAIIKSLNSKIWYRHWEGTNRDKPTKFQLDITGKDPNSKSNLKLELRWVLKETDHMYVPIDDHLIRGFFIPSGRQVGYFADKNKP
jgi:hypothetical protein